MCTAPFRVQQQAPNLRSASSPRPPPARRLPGSIRRTDDIGSSASRCAGRPSSSRGRLYRRIVLDLVKPHRAPAGRANVRRAGALSTTRRSPRSAQRQLRQHGASRTAVETGEELACVDDTALIAFTIPLDRRRRRPLRSFFPAAVTHKPQEEPARKPVPKKRRSTHALKRTIIDRRAMKEDILRPRRLLVHRNRWVPARRHDEHVLVVESVQEPEIVAEYASHMSSSWRERGFEVAGTGEVAGR